MILTFPWPSSALRPNASSPGNWWNKSKAAKSYKSDCIMTCRAARVSTMAALTSYGEGGNKPILVIIFRPPDKRRRDLDGMLSSFKQGIDAIAEEIGIDDSEFSLVISKGDPVKHGQVEVTLS